MANRRTFVALTALTASLVPIKAALGQTPTNGTGEADYLFVQTAASKGAMVYHNP